MNITATEKSKINKISNSPKSVSERSCCALLDNDMAILF